MLLKPVLKVMEGLNKALQSRNATTGGMLASMESAINSLNCLKSNEKFHELYTEAESIIDRHGLEEITLGRPRKVPRRYDGGMNSIKCYETAEEKYRAEFFEVIDKAIEQFKYYTDSSDLNDYKTLGNILIKGDYAVDIVKNYPELSDKLKDEVFFFRSQFGNQYQSLDECRKLFQNLVPEVKIMFPEICNLLRLLLISPASSCEAERTFSALRRMKTWLRSTMTQKRLENLMLCHIHKDILLGLDPKAIVSEFIGGNGSDSDKSSRKRVFGSA